MAEVIHEVNITEEAVFDYDCLYDDRKQESWGAILKKNGGNLAVTFEYYDKYDKPCGKFDTKTLQAELEEYIGYMTAADLIPWWGYFRADYCDEASGEMLKLFIRKGKLVGARQYWDLVGLMRAEDWTDELEDDGRIREWYNISVGLPDAGDRFQDWAVSDRVHRILQNTEKTLWKNVLREVLNEFNNERDKNDASDLAFLQSGLFEFRGRRKTKKRG
jgi:hypothetical protein